MSGGSATALREEVERSYAEAARALGAGDDGACAGGACPPGECGAAFGPGLYDAEQRAELPNAAALASLGCGNPTAVAELHEGEVVLDLGSGGGTDVILSAKRVGPSGIVYGLDITEEMLVLARANAAAAGVTNAYFLRGVIEEIPLPAEGVDVVISNCVINLSVDKAAVLAEIARVLKPGGRIGISDVVAEDRLSPAERAELGSHVGCIAGALSKSEYEAGLAAAGLADVAVTFTHEVVDGMHAAIVKARKPLEAKASVMFSEHYDRILRYVRSLVHDPTEAEDLTQEAFLRAHRQREGLRDPAAAAAWLYSIATHVSLDRLRQRARSRLSEVHVDPEDVFPADPAPSAELRVEQDEMSACVQGYVGELSDSYRAVLMLHDAQGLTCPEIAELLGDSLGSVKIRLHRARKKLQDSLENGCTFSQDERGTLVCEPKGS